MEILWSFAIVCAAAALAMWTNDNLPVGEYMTDELPAHSE
jgi:hypothetical protein